MELPWRPGTVGTDKPSYQPIVKKPVTTVTNTVTTDDLRIAGFDDAAIARIVELRAEWPWREFTADQRQWGYIQFARYLYRKGLLT